jgi:hypothetical protein
MEGGGGIFGKEFHIIFHSRLSFSSVSLHCIASKIYKSSICSKFVRPVRAGVRVLAEKDEIYVFSHVCRTDCTSL